MDGFGQKRKVTTHASRTGWGREERHPRWSPVPASAPSEGQIGNGQVRFMLAEPHNKNCARSNWTGRQASAAVACGWYEVFYALVRQPPAAPSLITTGPGGSRIPSRDPAAGSCSDLRRRTSPAPRPAGSADRLQGRSGSRISRRDYSSTSPDRTPACV